MNNLPKTFPDPEAFQAFLKGIDAVMFDCDGVIWVGMKVLPSAPELVRKLRSMGKKVFFMTNNSTKTREEFLIKFNTLGFEATLDEIVSTSFLAALHLKERNFDRKVYVIGTPGVTRELQAVNIKSLPIGADVVGTDMTTWASEHLEKMSLDPEVGAVIVGFDHHFSYSKLFKAASYLKDPSCIFIATNTDESFPAGNQMVIPGTGSIVNSVKTAAQREPIVMGKPHRIPFDYVRRFHNLESSRVLMIGDRANTDILFGTNCGLHTLLVLSGVTTLKEIQDWAVNGNEVEKQCVPEYYAEDTGVLYRLIENASA
jgi:phosphoglycolate phosphatase